MKMNFSTSQLLRLAGCFLFDIAIMIGFFSLFTKVVILEPFSSVVMFVVLVATLLIANGIILFSGVLYKKLGVVNATAIVAVVLAYSVIANLVSIFTITGAVFFYFILQLIILACMLILLTVIRFFAKQVSSDKHSQELELEMRKVVAVQLMNIEAALLSKKAEEGVAGLIRSFKELKERIEASTPFGRMTDNYQALEIENTVRGNLDYIYMQIMTDSSEAIVTEVSQILEETRRLVKNREILFIK